MISTHTYKLPNGLTVMLIDTKAFPSLTTVLFVKAGSRYENSSNNGIAHFFEHMAFKGSKKYPNAQKLANIIEGLGGVFNAFTSVDHTAYYVKAPAEDAATIVDVIGDMIQHPILDTKEIEKEKGVILQEMSMYEDMPQRRVYEIFESLLYPDNPLGFDIIGTKDVINACTQETFKDYIKEHYFPNNAVLVLSGGLTQGGRSLAYYKKIIKERFSSWKSKEPTSFEVLTEKQSRPELALLYKKSEQANFIIGFRSFSRFDDRKYTAAVLSTILGTGMSSRLFREVREKRGLCYSVRTFVEEFEDTGYFATYAGVEPSQERTCEAMKVILKEHVSIAQKSVTPDELRTAKEIIKGRLILSLEDTLNVASAAGQHMLFESEVLDVDDYIHNIEAVSASDVQRLAQDIFKDATLNCAIIGPFKNKAPFMEVLKVGR